MKWPKSIATSGLSRLLGAFVLFVLCSVSCRLWQRGKEGIAWDGDATQMMRRLVQKQSSVQGFSLEIHQGEKKSAVACTNPAVLSRFHEMTELTKFGDHPVGRVIPARLSVGACTISCAVVVEGSGIAIQVSNGILGDGSDFRLTRGGSLEKWILEQIPSR
ncbi:MAG: hypothetical protein IT579_24215 [Verrucomicrobia subdivision 3 bacterium]|nr:hypothetical protein [Limisphaerales bacterium]